MTRFQVLAEEIASLIAAGTLRPGDPLPSVRKAAAERKVSKGTVVQAYALLETRHLVEARPQSGFYVRAPAPNRALLPHPGLSRPSVVRSSSHERLRETLSDFIGARVTSLGSSFIDPTFFPMQSLSRALGASGRQGGYSRTLVDLQLGFPALRRAITKRYLELGYAVPTDEIVVTCGGMEAITLSLQAVTRPGDLVLIDSPTFFTGLELLKQLGVGALEMPTDPQDGLDLDLLDKTLSKHKVAACLLMTTCQNPLGFSLSEDKKRALARLLERHDVPLVENDVYAELQFDAQRVRAVKAFDTSGLVLHCGSFTKCLAPGFKVGWVAAGRFKEAVANRKFATTLGTSLPPQEAIAHYLNHHSYERHLKALRKTLARGVDRMSDAVFEYFPKATRLSKPVGGFVLWVEMPDRVDSRVLFERAANREIGIAPGPIFSANGGYTNYIRLNCSRSWSSSLDRTIRWLGEQVSEMAG